jgi:hypothetical protein
MAALREDDLLVKLSDARRQIESAIRRLRDWERKSPILTTQNQTWGMIPHVLSGVRHCLDIESDMLDEASRNPTQGASTEERRKIFEIQYLLFALIDEAAREVKTTIPSKFITPNPTLNSMIISRRARRSLYLHWRVVNLASTSKLLKAWHSGFIAELRSKLEDIHGTDVFVAHASADKPLVERVIQGIRAAGNEAQKNIVAAIDNFNGDVDQLSEVFAKQCEQLDAVSLGLWFDRTSLRSGDRLDAKIKNALMSAKVYLVFITKNYDLGTYMRDTEMKIMAEELKQLSLEADRIAIPVILSPKTWEEKKPQWVVPWRTVTCPPEPELYGVSEDPEALADKVIKILTSNAELQNLTGDDVSDLYRPT